MPSEPSPQLMLFNPDKPERHAASYAAVKAMEPLSRNTDSVGSFQAADRVAKTGRGSRRRIEVTRALQQHPFVTSAELSQRTGIDRYVAARTLSELLHLGWVVRGPSRRCSACGVVCYTWAVVRPWIKTPKAEGSTVPCKPEPQAGRCATNTTTGATTPARPRSATPAGLAPIPASVTSVAERRRLRDRLVVDGNEATRRFLGGLRK